MLKAITQHSNAYTVCDNSRKVQSGTTAS